MTKVRTALTIVDDIWRAVRIRAARTGKRSSEIIEAALRRDSGFNLLERLWIHNDMSEEEAMNLALEAQGSVRGSREA